VEDLKAIIDAEINEKDNLKIQLLELENQ